MKDGWIKLYRSSFENDLYFEEPFTKYMAWIDLLLDRKSTRLNSSH